MMAAIIKWPYVFACSSYRTNPSYTLNWNSIQIHLPTDLSHIAYIGQIMIYPCHLIIIFLSLSIVMSYSWIISWKIAGLCYYLGNLVKILNSNFCLGLFQ